MIIAALLLCSLIAPSSFAEDDFLILRDYGETHCRLFQQASLNPTPRLRQRVELLEEQIDTGPLVNIYENAPDFGFLLPTYWPVMSWAQRVRFNHAITASLKRRLNIASSPPSAEDCDSQIRIVEHPNQELADGEDESEIDLPRPIRLQAIILTQIDSMDDKRIPLTYHLEKNWNTGWQAEDIFIHTRSIKESDSTTLERVIREKGMDELEEYLESLNRK